MKQAIKKLALLAAMLAAGGSAQAQTTAHVVQAGVPYTFSNTTAASTASGSVTYQWYRNGEPIPGATNPAYTLPALMAYGKNQEFRRGAVSSTCPYDVTYANTFVVTFCDGVPIGSVCWAKTNVDAYQTFATQPDMYTRFYQWNRATAWPAGGSSVVGWLAADQSESWAVNPCPAGWRLPTQAEYQLLHDAGTTWVGASSARGNAVAGRFYGPNHNNAVLCNLPNNMNGCVFLPAAGYRNNSDGALTNQGTYGSYWSSTQNSATIGYSLYFLSGASYPANNLSKAYGFSVRCVQ